MENAIQEWDNKKIKSFFRKNLLLKITCGILTFLALAANIFMGSISFNFDKLQIKIIFCVAALLAIIAVATFTTIIPKLAKKTWLPVFIANRAAIVISTAQIPCFLYAIAKENGLGSPAKLIINNSNISFLLIYCFIPIVLIYAAISVTLFFLKKYIMIREQVVTELENRVLSILAENDSVSVKKLYRTMCLKRISFCVVALSLILFVIFSILGNYDACVYPFLVGFLSFISLAYYTISTAVRKHKISSQLPIHFSTLKAFVKNASC